VSRVSKWLSMAPMAVASDGSLIVNVAVSAGRLDPQKLVERALAEGRPVFVGIVLRPKEVTFTMKALDDSTAEIASWLWGARHRRRRESKRIKRRTGS
jgi:hypothetical protein